MYSARIQALILTLYTLLIISSFIVLIKIDLQIARCPVSSRKVVIKKCMYDLWINNLLSCGVISVIIIYIYDRLNYLYDIDFIVSLNTICVYSVLYIITYLLAHNYVYNNLMFLALKL